MKKVLAHQTFQEETCHHLTAAANEESHWACKTNRNPPRGKSHVRWRAPLPPYINVYLNWKRRRTHPSNTSKHRRLVHPLFPPRHWAVSGDTHGGSRRRPPPRPAAGVLRRRYLVRIHLPRLSSGNSVSSLLPRFDSIMHSFVSKFVRWFIDSCHENFYFSFL